MKNAAEMSNPFDQFDRQPIARPAHGSGLSIESENPFDQFDQQPANAEPGDPEIAEYEESGGGVLSSLERGARRLKQSLAGAGAALGDALVDDEGVFDTSPVGLWLKGQTERDQAEVMEQQQAIEALPQHPTMGKAITAANESGGYVDAAKAFLKEVWDSPDTSGFLIDATAELAPQALTMLVGAKGADKLLPVFLQGIGRTSTAMGAGGFLNSMANTYGPNLAEGLQKGFEFDQAEARAALQSLTQGGVDALTSAVVPWKIGPSQFTNIPAQTIVQMAGGATGEIARSRVVGETPEKGDVAAEALLEALGLPGDVMASINLKSSQKTRETTGEVIPEIEGSEVPQATNTTDTPTPEATLASMGFPDSDAGLSTAGPKMEGAGIYPEGGFSDDISSAPFIPESGDIGEQVPPFTGIPSPDAGLDTAPSIGYSPESYVQDAMGDTSPANPAMAEALQDAGISVPDNPTPERPESMQAQMEAFADGRKPGVLFTPGEEQPELPEGAHSAVIPDHGVLYYRDPETLTQAMNGQLGQALGYGIDEKPASDATVTARDKNGTVIQDVLTDGRQEVIDAATQVAGAEGSVEVRSAVEAMEERHKVSNGPGKVVNQQPEVVNETDSGLQSDQTHINAAAHEAATSPFNGKAEPTDAQKEAGNYAKGKLRLHGLDISIENPKGSVRRGTDQNGKAWSQTMRNHYGYFKASTGKDNDHVDVFLADQPDDPTSPVFIIDQVNPETNRFDEHKIIMGAKDEAEAIQTYQANYEPGWKGIGGIKAMPLEKFKAWVKNPRKTQRRASLKRYKYPSAQTTLKEPHPSSDTMPETGANSFAPGAEYVGFVQDNAAAVTKEKPDTKTKPIRREDVLIPFLKALDVPLYQGRVKGKNRLGFYVPKKEAVRIKRKNDLETAAHELAHLIDDRVPEIRRSWLKKVYREELKSISYDESKIYEGFAEFVRLYMTQNEQAKAKAPHYYEWFNAFTQRHEYGPAIEKARKGMTDWFNQDALTRASSKIGGGKQINESLHNVINSFRQSATDDLDGIYKMERKLTGKINSAGPYETARLTRGSYAMVEGALTIGAPAVNPDGSFSFKGKSLNAILEPVSEQIDEWTRYAVGRSAQELFLQSREHLFTRGEITAMLKLETPEFKRAFREYQTWNHRVVDFAQALGIINPETRKLWRRAQYLPFYRINTDSRQQSDSGVSGDWKGIQRLTGGTDNLRDVLQNMIQNASRLITEAVKNDARAQVATMADKLRGGGRFMVKIPKVSKKTKISKDEIIRIVNQAGIIPDDVTGDFSKLKDLVSVFQFGQSPKGKHITAVMREGKPVYYEVGDPLLMRAVNSLDRPTKNWITRFLGGFRRLGQTSVTLTADFMAANLARDTLMGGIMTKHGFKPFLDSIRGMKSRITKDPAYQEFIANGGGFSSVYLDDQAFRKRLERFYGRKGINYRNVIDTPAKFLYFLETLADAFEMSTRLGEFKRAQQAGAHPKHAAYSAREISTDFGMRGDSEVLGFFFDTVMFLKAGVNGMDRLYRGFAHDENRRQIAVRTGLLALASMALYAINRDNELYDKLEDWNKDGHWHFFIPKPGTTDQTPLEERYHHFYYPKLWEIGAIASIGERSMENLLNSTPKKLGRDFLRIVLEQFKLDYVPQAIEPLYEQYLNMNRHTKVPIETQSMEQLAPFARSKPYTANVLKDAGLKSRKLPRSLQIAPARTEALLRGYLNTWAMYGLSLTDAALYDDKPDMRVDQYPVLRRFYAKEPAKRTKYGTQFFDMLREATELRRTIKQMDKIGRPDIADEIEERKEIDRYTQLTRSNKQLQAINREMKQVYIDTRMTSEAKRRKLDALTQEKNTLLESVVKDIEAQETDQNK